ncbi:MAG TPA: hypothetical protein VFZ11_05875, partial [Gemmatimonadaceae bacterium]
MTLWQQLERLSPTPTAGDRGAMARFHGLRVLVALALAVLTYVLFPSAPAVEVPLYEVGAVATENVIAPFAYTVKKPTDQLEREREELARTAEPVFDYRPAALDSAQRALAALDQAIARAAPTSRTSPEIVAAVQQAAAGVGVELRSEEAAYLAAPRRREAMTRAVGRELQRRLQAGVAARGALDSLQGEILVRRAASDTTVPVAGILTFADYLARARASNPDPQSEIADAVYTKLLGAFFRPTLVENSAATAAARETLRRSVDENLHEVQAREKIIGANEVVGRAEHEKLRALQQQLQRRGSGGVLVGRVVGSVLFNFMLI